MSGLMLRTMLRTPGVWSSPFTCYQHRTAKGGKGGARVKKVLDVETDPEKLVNYVCGSNYKLEGEDVKIKPDSEYPDWLFTMDVKRPRPKSWEMEDKNTIEYWETVNLEGHKKRNRLMSQGLLKLQDKK